jgi:transposase
LTERQKAALQLTAILQPRLHRAYLLKEGIRLALKLPANEIREGIEKWGAGPGTRGSPKFVEL